ncbi:MAG: phenylalanyl-tRNA synthetase beta chain [Blastocatellia bacterium]|jgi:phenylalanyl-tRNA synthetase beta chain|nr:phenylalanyl-tRNA synthetase beta chain [Blastocatellia bacterium]
MNISYNWLRELTNTSLEARELAARLTLVGLAVDAVHEAGDDFVLDFDLTSNRPDCLSHLGIARELAVMESASVRLPEGEPSRMSGLTKDSAAVEIQDEALCPRYAARVVRGVKIAPSPEWLVRRLEAIGQRPINNVADITNFVLHEQGQPLHAFDLQKLAEQRIVVRRAHAGEKIRTLDGVERALDEQMLVIADARRAVAVAGVMGGKETEISSETTDVLIESAHFAPASVRRTSKLLGLHTEASHRFERGADYEGVLRAQARCVALICEIAGGTAAEDAIDVYPKPLLQAEVSLRPSRVKALSGVEVAVDEIKRILTSLGFEESAGQPETNASLSFIAPTWRVDIEREEDLVEEVVRHAGYDRIASELPPASMAGEYQPGEGSKRELRRTLRALGYDEAVSFSFIDAAHDEQFELIPGLVQPADDAERFVTLSNAIIEGATRMRPSLLAGLLDAVRHNFHHGTRDLQLFEVGRVFAAHPERGQLPDEQESLALVVTGGALEEGRAEAERELDFYDLKGALEAAVDAMKLPRLNFAAARVKHLREGQAATISAADNQALGFIGRLDEALAAEYKFRQPLYVAELNLTRLLETSETPVLYHPLARYPGIDRDISLLFDRRLTFAEMERAIFDEQVEDLRGVQLVDVYEGEKLPEGKRSLTLRIEYQADERTLRDEEVDAMHARIVAMLEQKFGAQLR